MSVSYGQSSDVTWDVTFLYIIQTFSAYIPLSFCSWYTPFLSYSMILIH